MSTFNERLRKSMNDKGKDAAEKWARKLNIIEETKKFVEKANSQYEKSNSMCDDHKLDNFDYTVMILKGFIEAEGESARIHGDAFLGRQLAYEEILEMLTRGDISEYK